MRKSIFLLLLSLTSLGFSQTFYNTNTIQRIEISFSQSNWDYILDTAKQASDSYLMSQWVKINGIKYDSAGVKYKGNSSYNPNNLKNPLHIELDHFVSKDHEGIKDIKLSNGYNEPSFVREVLLYNMFQKYGEASRANFAQVVINGQYMGVYTNVEAVTKSFLESRFYTKNNTFVFADLGGCNLRYKGQDTTQYYTPYTIKSDYGWTHLKRFCDTLRNNFTKIENSLDVDRALWHLSFNNLFVTLDSYTGASTHNYYMYRDHNKRFNPIIWDLNGGIGIFAKIDNGPNLTLTQMQNLSALVHQNDTMWPLIQKLLSDPLYKRMYIAHMKTLVQENIASGTFSAACLNYQSIADTAVFSDPYKFGTYSQFTVNLTSTVVLGPKTVPGIFPFMYSRMAYLNSTPEFTAAPPAITTITSSINTPVTGSTLYITANVSNASAVYLGKRNSVMERFYRVQMFDDGAHGDGASGDGNYGAQVTMSAERLQYYIYADNANAGLFSPARAEHEYYTLYAQGTAQPGQVKINEVLAQNQSSNLSEYGAYEDWVELFNTTNATINVGGYYLTDDYYNRIKYVFPSSTTIAPNGFLNIWIDGIGTPTSGLHANFKLNESGEQVMLSDGMNLVLDSVRFGNQTADISIGRCTDGIGIIAPLPYPSYAYNNCWVGVKENEGDIVSFKVFPNPTKGVLNIRSNAVGTFIFSVYDVTGRKLMNSQFVNATQLNVSELSAGIYILEVGNERVKFVKE